MAGFEDMVQRIATRFYKEVYKSPSPIELPPFTQSWRLAELALECGLVPRAAYGFHSPSDHDLVNTILVDLYHPTSSREGLVTQLVIQEAQLAQEGIHLDRSSLLELVKDDPYTSCYARFFDHLIGEGILKNQDDAIILEGFDGKVCALARYPGLRQLGTAFAVPRDGNPFFDVNPAPFLRETFDRLVTSKATLPLTQTGAVLSSSLDAAHRIIFSSDSPPLGPIHGGVPTHSLYGLDRAPDYERLTQALCAPTDRLSLETLAVQRALGIIADIGTVATGHRNIFALYGKFDIIAWEETLGDSGKNSIETDLSGRRCLVFSPQKVYTETELTDRFMSQAKARQAEAQLKRP